MAIKKEDTCTQNVGNVIKVIIKTSLALHLEEVDGLRQAFVYRYLDTGFR